MPTCLGPGQPGKKALRCAGLNQTSWQGLLDALKMSMDSPGLLAPKLTGILRQLLSVWGTYCLH